MQKIQTCISVWSCCLFPEQAASTVLHNSGFEVNVKFYLEPKKSCWWCSCDPGRILSIGKGERISALKWLIKEKKEGKHRRDSGGTYLAVSQEVVTNRSQFSLLNSSYEGNKIIQNDSMPNMTENEGRLVLLMSKIIIWILSNPGS